MTLNVQHYVADLPLVCSRLDLSKDSFLIVFRRRAIIGCKKQYNPSTFMDRWPFSCAIS